MKKIRDKRVFEEIPSAILVGDLHLRDNNPSCRTDNFLEAQWRKIRFISELKEKWNIPILQVGDIFEKWRSSPYLEARSIGELPEFCSTIGNHDIPGYNTEDLYKTSLEVLRRSGKVRIITKSNFLSFEDKNHVSFIVRGFEWGDTNFSKKYEKEPKFDKRIAIIHYLIYKGENDWPDLSSIEAKELLSIMDDYDLILTGHNHKTFTEELDGRILVNPGSISRQKSDQFNHKPCVYLWYSGDNSIEKIDLPIEWNVIDREFFMEEKELINERKSFTDRLKLERNDTVSKEKLEFSFEKNLDKIMNNNPIRKPVKDIVWKAFKGEDNDIL